ncbi:hypothetical protein R50073_09000 [Maricurvus nonylphenolicus]
MQGLFDRYDDSVYQAGSLIPSPAGQTTPQNQFKSDSYKEYKLDIHYKTEIKKGYFRINKQLTRQNYIRHYSSFNIK